jgi:hypothetical protein
MPYELLSVKGIIAGLATALSSLALWVVHGLVSRIDTLEEDMEHIKTVRLKEKLDRIDYIREQETLHETIREDMKELRERLSNLPHQIVSLLKDTGRI